MVIVRVENADGEICYGCEVGSQVFRLEGDLFGEFWQSDQMLQPVRRLAPVVPSVIYAIGMNYAQHATEIGAQLPEYPIVFMKSPSSTLDPERPILLPRHLHSDQVDYEGELAVVIARDCKNVSTEDALEYVLGYTCANDVSARDWQNQHGGGQWVKGKSFDTFCPLGPVLVTSDCIPNPQLLPIRTILNGQIRQESYTGEMIFSVAEIIAFLSASTTLKAGSVILTGTPPGVGVAASPTRFLKPGDDLSVEITGIGRLRNPVEAEQSILT
jgi:2-keto-4-pentenoate hydratase/2-oxohepta-3-ene-1,7-dioic acid hydratase in catechol pathway